MPLFNYSTRIAVRSTGFLRRLKRIILKRIVVFRLLFYGSVMFIVSSSLAGYRMNEVSKTITPSFFVSHTTIKGQRFKLSGVIKTGSIEMKKGTLENKFVLTDFKNDMTVYYKGALPLSFKEGDVSIVGGFLSDPKNPTSFVATSVTSNHEITPEKWIGESAVEKVRSINMIQNIGNEFEEEYTQMK